MLLALSFSFLALVLVNGLFRLVINTRKGRLGERLLRRLRFELADRILRFPLPHLRRVKPSEMATMIKDEVEPLGGFIGDAFATPLFLGGQRSEEHTSELQSLMRHSYAVFCLKKKKKKNTHSKTKIRLYNM